MEFEFVGSGKESVGSGIEFVEVGKESVGSGKRK